MIPADQSTQRLILASSSRSRAALLKAAGVAFSIEFPGVDEASVRASLEGKGNEVDPSDVALVLAQTKASVVSERNADALVIGADQVLVCEGRVYSKPEGREAARDQLIDLRGKSHSLISAVACARAGTVEWTHDAEVRLTMREFSNTFLGTYLAMAGDAVTQSVGAYQLEGPGIQLFSRIEGDYFTILGLPLLPLLGYLRDCGVIGD